VALVRERTIPSYRRLSAKLVPTFADRECHVVSVTDPYDRILGFLDRTLKKESEINLSLCLIRHRAKKIVHSFAFSYESAKQR
jgi:hypothetical protein